MNRDKWEGPDLETLYRKYYNFGFLSIIIGEEWQPLEPYLSHTSSNVMISKIFKGNIIFLDLIGN